MSEPSRDFRGSKLLAVPCRTQRDAILVNQDQLIGVADDEVLDYPACCRVDHRRVQEAVVLIALMLFMM